MINHVNLIGRLTKEVDLRYTQSGTPVGSFILAVNRSFTNQQGEREADFIRCVIWRKAAENLANFTRKGSLIGLEGSIQTRIYDDDQGNKVYITEVNVRNFHLLEPKEVTEQRPIDNNSQQIYPSNRQNVPQETFSPSNQYNQPFTQQNGSQAQDFSNIGMGKSEINEDDLPF
ncbi:single-stranded DNA-binding protein [Facklamia sp. P12934]|uniref:single-stranded DNA-binding protein n=1 Tax=Facklamia sp. P12934 TaxID=3421948 RepID=UPI003D16C366